MPLDGTPLWGLLVVILVPIWAKVRKLVKRLRLNASGRLLLTIEDMPQPSSDSHPSTKPSQDLGKKTASSVPLPPPDGRLNDERVE
jgi:hypothetical protein